MHGLDNVAPLAKLFQSHLGLAVDDPASRLRLSGKAIAFQTLRPTDHEMPVLADEVAAFLSRPQLNNYRLTPVGSCS